jgi:hypothetical protein
MMPILNIIYHPDKHVGCSATVALIPLTSVIMYIDPPGPRSQRTTERDKCYHIVVVLCMILNQVRFTSSEMGDIIN